MFYKGKFKGFFIKVAIIWHGLRSGIKLRGFYITKSFGELGRKKLCESKIVTLSLKSQELAFQIRLLAVISFFFNVFIIF